MQQNLRGNKMGVLPVGKLLANMARPRILRMRVQALHNVVDPGSGGEKVTLKSLCHNRNRSHVTAY